MGSAQLASGLGPKPSVDGGLGGFEALKEINYGSAVYSCVTVCCLLRCMQVCPKPFYTLFLNFCLTLGFVLYSLNPTH